MNNIYLIGFMGAGKTTLAHSLAEVLNLNCMDLDQCIEKEEKTTISTLFEKQGEAYFRDLEVKYLKKTENLKSTIISTGGGIIGYKENRVFLKNQLSIYLDWPFDVLYTRIAGDKERPLSKSYDQLKALHKERLPFYEESSKIHLKCNEETPYLLVQKTVDILRKGGYL